MNREEIIEYYRGIMEAGTNYQGLTTLRYEPQIRRLLTKHKAKTLLDYGCGAGEQYFTHHLHQRLGIPMPALYDPACAKHRTKPIGTYDGVVCSDVLEHVAESEIDEVLDDLHGYAKKFVFAAICCRPASKLFPDGSNVHLLVQPRSWWLAKFKERARPDLDVWIVWSN